MSELALLFIGIGLGAMAGCCFGVFIGAWASNGERKYE